MRNPWDHQGYKISHEKVRAMYVKQIYTGCLAQAAYYIESESEAAIIDPLRETEPYVELAKERGTKIRYIFETHFHADFVSGHIDLAKETGAKIIYGPTAKAGYEVHVSQDGEEFRLGKVTFKVLHTPGHTMESSTFLLKDENGKDYAIFTGDTLFIGDVGRPDLAIKSNLTREDLAGMLYDSLRKKIMPLENDVIVYPAHGAGSACGKNMSKETFATLGNQKQFNYALQDMSKEEFIKQVTTGIAPPPQYFPKNAAINKAGYESYKEVLEHGTHPLSVEQAVEEANEGALILDTRDPNEFCKGFIPGSMNIGLGGSFAVWVGTLIPDITRPIVLVAEEGRIREAVTRLARVGYDNTIGYIQGGIQAWKDSGRTLDMIENITPQELTERMKQKIEILDVRKPSEFNAQHVVGAENFPLDFINDHFQEIDKGKKYYLNCRSGYRSMIAASILKSIGVKQVVNVKEGMEGILQTKLPLTTYVCPTTVES
jgi:hydroxyacylglutathione hydrolase